MRTVIQQAPRKGQVWIVSLDVSEVPDMAKMPVLWSGNASRHADHSAYYAGRDVSGMGHREFYLGDLKNQKAADELFHRGWKEGGEKALKLADGLVDNVSQPLSIRRRVRFSDDGDEFDKERLLGGHLDQAWRTTSRQMAVATPIINIACGWGGNCDMSHDQLFWTGAAAIALVRILEAAGYQTSLTSVMTNRQGDSRHVAIACSVKAAGEYLRADAIASTLCLGATFRTYCFLAIISCPWQTDSGLGHQISVDELLPAVIEADMIDRPQIVIPGCYGEASARQAILDALAELQAANLAALPEEIVRQAKAGT